MKVGIVGQGEAAEALEILCRRAGSEVLSDLPWLAAGGADACDLVLLAVPPDAVRATVRSMRPGPAARIVVTTRGLEPGTGRRLSQIVAEESACLRVGALAGPILAAEVRRGSPCAAVAASRFDEVARQVAVALHSPACRVYTSDDLAGVEVAGALVEVLAMALGVARGLGLGVGAQALIVTRGSTEGARLARKESGDVRTFSGLAGVGELVACAGLADHPGHVRGLAMARGEPDPAAVALCDALLARVSDLPITGAVRMLASGRARAADVLAALMTREQAGEFDA